MSKHFHSPHFKSISASFRSHDLPILQNGDETGPVPGEAQNPGVLSTLVAELSALTDQPAYGTEELENTLSAALQTAGHDGMRVAVKPDEDPLRLTVSQFDSENVMVEILRIDAGSAGLTFVAGSRSYQFGPNGQWPEKADAGSPSYSPEISSPAIAPPPAIATTDTGLMAAPPPPPPANTVSQAQLAALATGIENAMSKLHQKIVAQVLAETLPLVGSGLSTAAQANEVALGATTALGDTLSAALNSIADVANRTTAQVEQTLNAALAAAGFGANSVVVTSTGDNVQIKLGTQKTGSYVQNLASDLGMAGLGAVGGGSATIGTTFDFDIGFGVTNSGFFLETSAAEDVTVAFSLDNTNFDPTLRLAGQNYNALDAGTTFDGTFSIDLVSGNDLLSVAQIRNATMNAELTGAANLGVGIELQSKGDMTPTIGATLTTQWDFTNAAVSTTDNNISFGDRPDIAFDSVTMDLGKFMENFVGPLVEKVDALLAPVRPILDVLDAPIRLLETLPGIGDLMDRNNDGRVTLIDIIEIAFPDTDTTAFQTLINVANDVADWAGFLATTGFADGDLILGDIDFGTADIRTPGFDLTNALANFGGLADDIGSVISGLSGSGWNTIDSGSGLKGVDILDEMINGGIFGMPILTDSDQWINLLLGKPADLVSVDLPELVIGQDKPITLFKFPVFPAVFVNITGYAMAVINLDFGFDTRGLLDDTLQAIDGFYVVDDPTKAEIVLESGVGLEVELNLLVASVSGGGDVAGTINLDLNDSLGSTPGKLYYDEFIDTLNSNPFSIFDASGSITAGFTAVVDTILGELWRWSSPRLTIGNFGFDSPGGNVNIATKSGDTLTLHIGDLTALRDPLTLGGGENDNITIGDSTTGGKLAVTLNEGFTEEFTNITTIVGDGGKGKDSLYLVDNLAISAVFSGGANDDILSGAALADILKGNAGNDMLWGYGGNDTLLGQLGDDVLIGGKGADTIDGGSGTDRASYYNSLAAVIINFSAATQSGGDAQGDILTSIEHLEGSIFDDTITGSQGVGSIYGLAGNDTITGGTHVQGLFGNAGDDFLKSTVAGSTLSGGEGDDTYVVKANNIRLNENELGEIAAGSDSGYDWIKGFVSIDLRGTDEFIERITLFNSATDAFANDRDNLIEGNNKDNGLYGLGGADTIYGNDGNDRMYGHKGDDSLYGGLNDDTMYGGEGGDFIDGGSGNDSLYGDEILGLGGEDTLYGFAGNDLIYGRKKADKIYGGLDHDELYGGGGSDIIYGGFGIDILYGDQGADTLRGGAGADFYKVDSLDEVYELNVTGKDYVWADDDHALLAGQSVEYLSAYFWEPSILLAIAIAEGNGNYDLIRAAAQTGKLASNPNVNLTGNEKSQMLISEMTDPDIFVGNTLEGMGGADVILGDGYSDFAAYTMSGAAVTIDLSVNEQVGGHAEGDYLLGFRHVIGSGFNDTILGESLLAGADIEYDNSLDGGAGDDTINGFGGNDQLVGGDGNDFIDAGSGDDTLNGGAGDDTLWGGGGNDRYVVTQGDTLLDTSGVDTVVATEDYYLAAGLQIETLKAQAGSDADNVLFGNTYDQTITGNASNNTIHGGGGSDVINGRGGDDLASYALSNAAIDVNLNRELQNGGHAEGDRIRNIENLRGSIFGDTLVGQDKVNSTGSADNTHYGGAGNDTISDSYGHNTLYGGLGADTLIGNGKKAGSDSYGSLLIGGLGADTLDGGASTDIGGDTLAGGMGDDTYIVTSTGDIVDENWAGDIATGADGGHDLIIIDVDVWDMDTPGQADIEDVELGLGHTVLTNDLDNVITGNSLANDITARAGDDTLIGKSGNDTLRGGAGNDVLRGGAGKDEMYGGYGNDIFEINVKDDKVIEKLDKGIDTINSKVSYTLSANVENLNLTGSLDINGTGNKLGNDIVGNDGNNRLNGRLGADTLTGGAGADKFVFRVALDDVDTITDFETGVDKIRLDDAIFTELSIGNLNGLTFSASTTGMATLPTQHILYSTSSGNLYYDEDGAGTAQRVHFATLEAGLSIGFSDFVVF